MQCENNHISATSASFFMDPESIASQDSRIDSIHQHLSSQSLKNRSVTGFTQNWSKASCYLPSSRVRLGLVSDRLPHLGVKKPDWTGLLNTSGNYWLKLGIELGAGASGKKFLVLIHGQRASCNMGPTGNSLLSLQPSLCQSSTCCQDWPHRTESPFAQTWTLCPHTLAWSIWNPSITLVWMGIRTQYPRAEDIFNMCGQTFSPTMTALIADQMVCFGSLCNYLVFIYVFAIFPIYSLLALKLSILQLHPLWYQTE